MSCPLKKSWKLRWRKARRVAGNPILDAGEPFKAWSSELAVAGGLCKGKSSLCHLKGCRDFVSRFNPALASSEGLSLSVQRAVSGNREIWEVKIQHPKSEAADRSVPPTWVRNLSVKVPLQSAGFCVEYFGTLPHSAVVGRCVCPVGILGTGLCVEGKPGERCVTEVTWRSSHLFFTGACRVDN